MRKRERKRERERERERERGDERERESEREKQKERVVIENLSKANFDPEFYKHYTTEIQKEFSVKNDL